MSKAMVVEKNPARTLYGNQDQVDALAEVVCRVAPWASPSVKRPLSKQEIGLVVRRAIGMGLDPLNPHEIQIWKDKRGTVNFQLAYTLLTQWVNQIHGGHTDPEYCILSSEEKQEHGLFSGDIAVEARFILIRDFEHIDALIDAGIDPVQAIKMLTTTGIGVASAEEYASKYFAPAARSKLWKVQKRALTDAYRRKFGVPSRADIEELRRLRGEDRIQASDWQVAAEQLPASASPEEQARLAKTVAADREREPDNRTPEEILEEGRALLRGDHDDAKLLDYPRGQNKLFKE